MTASNFVEIPKELFNRILAALADPSDLTVKEVDELLEDVQQWIPPAPATDEEIDRSFDAYR